MKHLAKVLGILTVLGFLLFPFQGLGAEENKAETAEKAETMMCCPVCCKTTAAETAQFKSEYKEMAFYFDSEKCKTEFDKDPEKFIKSCKDRTKCSKGAKYYVCPMKECDVKSDKPGKCPKCGMELKEATQQATCCKLRQDKDKQEEKKETQPGEHKH